MTPQADVLLVTASKVETLAVFQAFRDATDADPQPQAIGDKTYHDLGTVNETRVWLVQSEQGTARPGRCAADRAEGDRGSVAERGGDGRHRFRRQPGEAANRRYPGRQQLLLYEPQRVGTDVTLPRAGTRPTARPACWIAAAMPNLYWVGATVRFGLVLSGEKLVDNLAFRQELLEFEPEAIGGEMEGAGLYTACQDRQVDWILVKAICDWADEQGRRQGRTAGDRGAQRDPVRAPHAENRRAEAGTPRGACAPADCPARAGRDLVPSTLPPQPYFFGREAELAEHRGGDLARGAHLGRADRRPRRHRQDRAGRARRPPGPGAGLRGQDLPFGQGRAS